LRVVDVSERRARLAVRHRLASGQQTDDVVEAVESVVALHASDPATVYLSVWARMRGMTVAHLEEALFIRRSLVKHMAMRRTLFVLTRDLIPYAQAGASNRVADQSRRRVIAEAEKAGLHDDAKAWLDAVCAEVLRVLSDGREATFSELRDAIPLLQGTVSFGEGKRWGGEVAIGPRVLGLLSAEGRILRSSNDGSWAISRPRWAATRIWLGAEIEPMDETKGLAGLVERWLRRFGPGTEADLRWWLGQTLGAVRRALATLDVSEVDVAGQTAYLMADDIESVEPVEPWAALLPGLDPTVMGWQERGWYLGSHKDRLFDRNGNAGPTVWWDGQIVGGWRQGKDGEVVVQMLEDVGSDGRSLIDERAQALTAWLEGRRILPMFPSPLFKEPV
jgi:hypothetical protein